jgi:hypothetical protein
VKRVAVVALDHLFVGVDRIEGLLVLAPRVLRHEGFGDVGCLVEQDAERIGGGVGDRQPVACTF